MRVMTKRRLLMDVLLKPHGKSVALAFFLIWFSAFVGMAQPFVVRDLVDVAIPSNDFSYVSKLAFGLIVIAACVNIINVIQVSILNKVGHATASSLRVKMFGIFMDCSLEFFHKTNPGALQSRIMGDVSKLQNFFSFSSASLASYTALIIANIVALAFLDARLLLIPIILVPLAAYVNIVIGEKKKTLARKTLEETEGLGKYINQYLSESGASVIRTFGRDRSAREEFKIRSNDLSIVEVSGSLVGRWQLSLINFIFACSPALTYWFAGAIEMKGGGQISIGTIVAATGVQYSLFGPFIGVLKIIIELKSLSLILERIVDAVNNSNVGPRVSPNLTNAHNSTVGDGFIVCDKISFSYGVSDSFAIQEANLRIGLGSKVAIVGASGSGKSTLAHILCGLYMPANGKVLIDGKDIGCMSYSVRSELVGIVSQDCYLFGVSIFDNFQMVCPEASMDQIVDCCKDARIHDFISSLPEGYETIVGERGGCLSGGQRQRIALARMLLKRPKIIIFDEATSALDPILEKEIFELVKIKLRENTVIFVTHRLSSIQDFDEILLINNGAIISQASHFQLLDESEIYKSLVNSQTKN